MAKKNAGGKPKGLTKSGGRTPGTPNKRTLDLIATLESKGYDAAAEMVWIYMKAKESYLEAPDMPQFLDIAQKTAKELLQYVYPKRKAIEVSQANPFEGLSKEEMITKARELVRFLEEE